MKTCLSAVYDKLKPILLCKRKNPSSAKYKNLATSWEGILLTEHKSPSQRPLHFFIPTLSLSLIIIIFFLIIWQQFILELQQNQTRTNDQSLNLHKETSDQKYMYFNIINQITYFKKYMIWFIIHRHFDFEAMKACEIKWSKYNRFWRVDQFSKCRIIILCEIHTFQLRSSKLGMNFIYSTGWAPHWEIPFRSSFHYCITHFNH